MIETYKRFKEAQVLLLTKIPSPLLNDFNFVLNSYRIRWHGVRIDVDALKGPLWTIPRVILKNVQFVSFISSHELYSSQEDDVRFVLSSTPKISHLQFAKCIFESKDVFRYPFVQENLRNLKRLDILGWNDRCNENNQRTESCNCFGSYARARFDNLFSNFVQAASLLQRLESLRIPKLEFSENHKRIPQTTVVELLQRNRESLRELSVHLDFWEPTDICALKLPRLQVLTVTVYKADQDNLSHFLLNHDTLEELDVAVKKEFGKNLFDIIKQRSGNLKKLHLKAKKFVEFVGGREEFIDWTFLGAMTHLKDFQLCRPKCKSDANWETYGNGRRLLESLPRNQLQRTIELQRNWR